MIVDASIKQANTRWGALIADHNSLNQRVNPLFLPICWFDMKERSGVLDASKFRNAIQQKHGMPKLAPASEYWNHAPIRKINAPGTRLKTRCSE
jgi:hypothetical protein